MNKKKFHFFAFAAAIYLNYGLVLFPSPAFAAASATLVKIDTATMGSWIGAYGSDGYIESQYSVTKYPAYATVALSKQANWTWAASTSRLAAVQKPDNPQDRIAGQWFSGTSFFIDIALTDGNSHQVVLYALDWDRNQRAETINVRDATTGALLDSRPLSAGTFIEGVYLIWNVQGHITFEIARNAGANSTLSALFFDPTTSGQASIQAVPANDFLNSLGVDPGYLQMMTTAPLFQYTGIRNYRVGTGDPSTPIALHNATVIPGIYPGVRFNLVGHDVPISARIAEGAAIASAGALLSFEGPNEPNSFPFTYNGQIGGGSHSWLPVAQYQRDFYAAVKADPRVSSYPVFGTSLVGSELDNVGMQFLTIPTGANVLMPDGTRYADYANPHNYVVGNGGCGVLRDNQAWNAADPILPGCWDNLYNEYGVTWYGHYAGYTEAQLMTLPRVTTETGWGTSGISEDNQGKVLLNVLLAQFKRGWSYTFIYELVDG
ncbi:MAG: hypothetical protein J2P49_03290, partial [Methylocapsa sp.]|nr:hypothetical protein [Methylocapsa sp.]